MAMLGHAKSLKSKGNMIHVLALTDHLEGYSKARAGHATAGLRSIQVAGAIQLLEGRSGRARLFPAAQNSKIGRVRMYT